MAPAIQFREARLDRRAGAELARAMREEIAICGGLLGREAAPLPAGQA